jgi:hypothetical protein
VVIGEIAFGGRLLALAVGRQGHKAEEKDWEQDKIPCNAIFIVAIVRFHKTDFRK